MEWSRDDPLNPFLSGFQGTIYMGIVGVFFFDGAKSIDLMDMNIWTFSNHDHS